MKQPTLYPRYLILAWVVVLPLGLVVAGGLLVGLTGLGELPFDNLDLWWTVAAVPLASLLTLFGIWRSRSALYAFSSRSLAPLLLAGYSASRALARRGILLAAIVMLTIALLGPRWGIYLEQQEVYGTDIVAVVDVSRSMLARDLEPNRLARTREEIRQQLTERAVFKQGHRLGLMLFAGSTVIRLPLTTDHFAFRNRLSEVEVGSVKRGGTNIGQAIERAVDLFAGSPERATRIMLLFTDGEDHGGRGEEAARIAYEEHDVRVFPIGIGDAASSVGARVPESADSDKPLLYEGQIVFSKLNVEDLRAIAKAGNGRYAQVENLNRVVDAIAGMRHEKLTTEERMRHRPRYQWFLAAALALMAIEFGLVQKPGPDVQADQRVWNLEA